MTIPAKGIPAAGIPHGKVKPVEAPAPAPKKATRKKAEPEVAVEETAPKE